MGGYLLPNGQKLQTDEYIAWLERNLGDAVTALGDAVRAHTRAIWAIKGELEYPEAERYQTGRYLGDALVRLNAVVEAEGDDD